MGVRGPVPNRSNDYSRERDAARLGGDVTKARSRKAKIPTPNPDWHHVCKMLWEAAHNSGQCVFYQETDWVFLYSILDDLSAVKSRTTAEGDYKPSAMLLQTIYSTMSSLGFTEGDRRRMRIELDNDSPDVEDKSITAISDYKRKLGLVK